MGEQLIATEEGLGIVLEYAALGDLADFVMAHRDVVNDRGLPEILAR
jgi:hypothetical protein